MLPYYFYHLLKTYTVVVKSYLLLFEHGLQLTDML